MNTVSLGNRAQSAIIGWNNSVQHPVVGPFAARVIGAPTVAMARICDTASCIIQAIGEILGKLGIELINIPRNFTMFILRKDFYGNDDYSIKRALDLLGQAILYGVDIPASFLTNLLNPNLNGKFDDLINQIERGRLALEVAQAGLQASQTDLQAIQADLQATQTDLQTAQAGLQASQAGSAENQQKMNELRDLVLKPELQFEDFDPLLNSEYAQNNQNYRAVVTILRDNVQQITRYLGELRRELEATQTRSADCQQKMGELRELIQRPDLQLENLDALLNTDYARNDENYRDVVIKLRDNCRQIRANLDLINHLRQTNAQLQEHADKLTELSNLLQGGTLSIRTLQTLKNSLYAESNEAYNQVITTLISQLQQSNELEQLNRNSVPIAFINQLRDLLLLSDLASLEDFNNNSMQMDGLHPVCVLLRNSIINDCKFRFALQAQLELNNLGKDIEDLISSIFPDYYDIQDVDFDPLLKGKLVQNKSLNVLVTKINDLATTIKTLRKMLREKDESFNELNQKQTAEITQLRTQLMIARNPLQRPLPTSSSAQSAPPAPPKRTSEQIRQQNQQASQLNLHRDTLRMLLETVDIEKYDRESPLYKNLVRLKFLDKAQEILNLAKSQEKVIEEREVAKLAKSVRNGQVDDLKKSVAGLNKMGIHVTEEQVANQAASSSSSSSIIPQEDDENWDSDPDFIATKEKIDAGIHHLQEIAAGFTLAIKGAHPKSSEPQLENHERATNIIDRIARLKALLSGEALSDEAADDTEVQSSSLPVKDNENADQAQKTIEEQHIVVNHGALAIKNRNEVKKLIAIRELLEECLEFDITGQGVLDMAREHGLGVSCFGNGEDLTRSTIETKISQLPDSK